MDIDSPSKLETPSSNNLRAGDGVGDDSGDCNGDINLRNLLSAEFSGIGDEEGTLSLGTRSI